MTILGLETSTAVCSVGLYRTSMPEIELSLLESHIHSEKLLTLVQDVIRSSGTALDQLDAIAVSIGPGSFTGLRIGLSTAKGLSFALGKPLVAVSTFEAIAEAAWRRYPTFSAITVLVDARKNEWYTGQYRVTQGKPVEVTPVEVLPLETALATVERAASSLVLTDKVSAVRLLVGEAATVDELFPYCRGAVVASLAAGKASRGEFSDAASLEPMYLKNFVVRTAASIS
jgi:tRNA threonylcarbamoyladenosine biosynthesis protein TsaB